MVTLLIIGDGGNLGVYSLYNEVGGGSSLVTTRLGPGLGGTGLRYTLGLVSQC